jgi:hypothetical protein
LRIGGPCEIPFTQDSRHYLDANGNVLQPSKLISSTTHLPRGDDAFILDGRAAWMTGDQNGLYIHFVDALLNYEEVRVD